MQNFPLPRIDKDEELTELLLPYCRFQYGTVWEDPLGKHKILCADATDDNLIGKFKTEERANLAIQDPPYNFVAFDEKNTNDFILWSKKWVKNTENFLCDDSSFYIWLGANQNDNFRPFPQFIIMMESTKFRSRSFITMRNQRGFGTQKNWMAVRQELLYYVSGKPVFNVSAEYTDIPKVLKGYYKNVNGKLTENIQRSKSQFIRAGNVWIDIQQVFYRMEENVNGCYVQKPLKAIERIILASSNNEDLVIDFFAHSGATLIAAEKTGRRCFTADLSPVYCEIALRRLEHFRQSAKTGWQNSNPFFNECINDKKLKFYLNKKYKLKIN